MPRIIGGTAGGRRLVAPKGMATRPTAERVREALFSMLQARDAIAGATVLDLYAGSGALGLEAASRGAARVDLVEKDRATARLIARNGERLGLVVHVHTAAVRAFTARPATSSAQLVLADPPYPMREAELAADLTTLAAGSWLAPGALVVVERAARSPEPVWPDGWEMLERRRYGESALWFARAAPGDGGGPVAADADDDGAP